MFEYRPVAIITYFQDVTSDSEDEIDHDHDSDVVKDDASGVGGAQPLGESSITIVNHDYLQIIMLSAALYLH